MALVRPDLSKESTLNTNLSVFSIRSKGGKETSNRGGYEYVE